MAKCKHGNKSSLRRKIMALSEVVELTQMRPDRIVQRVPETGDARIKFGAQLIVSQGQEAVFFRDGKSLDVLGPGRHTLSTANVPLLTSFLSNLGFGKDSIFQAAVYYVAMREFPQEGWGTRQPIAMQTPGQGLGWLLLGGHGTFGFQVQDAKRVVDTLAGGQPYLDMRDLKTRLTNILVQAATDWFAEVNPGHLMKAQSMMDEMSMAMKVKAQPEFEALGLVLKNITVGGLSPLETSAEKLQQMGLLDAQMYMQLQAMNTIKEASQGGGQAGTGVGLGAGMGAGMGMGQMMAGMFGGMQQAGAQPAAPAAAAEPAAATPDIMGVTEAAAYLGVSVEDVVELCNSGQLKAKKIGSQYRISKAAIDEFMKS
jgi:excisionase family DNA binding protein